MATRIGRHASFVAPIACAFAFAWAATVLASNQSAPERLATVLLPEESRQTLIVLIGSAACRFSRDASTRRAFDAIVQAEVTKSPLGRRGVLTVGIAVDDEVADGLMTLREVSDFDELIVGGGFLNTGATRYLTRDFAGRIAVPQILILSRSLHREGAAILPGPDSLHRRLVGIDELTSWAGRLSQKRT
jgi:hypothetical protein